MMKQSEQIVPLARTAHLVTQQLPDELMVYDTGNDKVHCLNKMAAAVWRQCDGRQTVAEVARALSLETGAALDEKTVWYVLRQLDKRALFDARLKAPAGVLGGISRREAVRRLTIGAAVAVPLITTMVAPTAAHAQSGVAGCANPCTNDNDCTGQDEVCSDNCCVEL